MPVDLTFFVNQFDVAKKKVNKLKGYLIESAGQIQSNEF